MSFRKRKEQPFNPEVFDVSSIEDEIGGLVRHDNERRAFNTGHPKPDRALHQLAPPDDQPSVDSIGQVTAEAVMAQYEAAAKTIEAMREPMKNWTDHCQTALADLKAAMEYIDETAKRFRELGQTTHDRIQRSSAAITEVRQTCDSIREKIDPQTQQ
jgi:hypothetical protein